MKWDFEQQLALYGPSGSRPAVTRAEAWQYCKRLAENHYENFSVATLLLPRQLLRHFHAVYSYCRWSDDLADETGATERALFLLKWWREQLNECYAGKPRHPVFVALSETVQRFHVPIQPFLDLLTAFEQDQQVTRYETFDELLGYCRNSANPVGRLVLYLCERHDSQNAEFSDNVCTALQLANFWQDVARDLAIGRVYLPVEDRIRFHYLDQDLYHLRFNQQFADLLRFEVDRTRELFFRGYPLIDRLPRQVSGDVELFIQGGLAILRKIEQANYNVLDRRPALSKWDKGRLFLGVLWQRLGVGWSR